MAEALHGIALSSRRFLVVLGLVALGGCATTYHPKGATGGYGELQLASNVYRVSFQGNGYTGEERVADFALLRASELALAHGSKYFLVVKEGGEPSRLSAGARNPGWSTDTAPS